MDCSTPGFPIPHQLPELTQTQVHRVGDAIQLSHPLSSPSPLAFNLSSIRVFSSKSVLRIKWPKYWSFNFSVSPSYEYSGLIPFRMVYWLDLLAVQGTLKSLLQHHSSNDQFLLNFRFAAWIRSSGLFPLLCYKALSRPSPLLLRIQVPPPSSDLLS